MGEQSRVPAHVLLIVMACCSAAVSAAPGVSFSPLNSVRGAAMRQHMHTLGRVKEHYHAHRTAALKAANSAFNFEILVDDDSVGCRSAINTTLEVFSSCSSEADELFAGNGTAASFCEGASSCAERSLDALTNAIDNCNDEDSELQHLRRLIVAHVEAVCNQVDGEYCLPDLIEFVDAMTTADESDHDNEDGLPSDAQLEAMCNPCVIHFIEALAAAAGDEDDASLASSNMNLMCLKFDGKFCIRDFWALDMFGEDQCNPTMCEPCIRKVFGAITEILAINFHNAEEGQEKSEGDMIIAVLNAFFRIQCEKTNDGKRCLELNPECSDETLGIADDIEEHCSSINVTAPGAVCSDGCAAAQQAQVGVMGCCLASTVEILRELVEEIGDNETTGDMEASISFMEEQCGVEFGESCSLSEWALIEIDVTLSNMDSDEAQLSTEEICSLLAVDLMKYLALTSAETKSCEYDANNSRFKLVIEAPVDDIDLAVAELEELDNEGALSWAALESLGLEYRTDPIQSFSADINEISVVKQSASSVVPAPAAGIRPAGYGLTIMAAALMLALLG